MDRQRRRRIAKGKVLLKATVLTLGLALGATAVHAADTCYQGASGSILVFKKFRLPKAGECSEITGYQNNTDCTLSGTACGTSDNLMVHFNFNFICHFSGFGTYDFFTDRSVNQGDGQFCQVNTSNGQFTCPTFIASKVSCPANKQFIF